MAETTYLFVAGNGKTSSTNIETLLDDYIHALKRKKQTPVLVVIYDDYLSEGQTYALNVAKNLKVDIVAYVPNADRATTLPQGSTFVESKAIFKDAASLFKGDSNAFGLLLWNDEDQRCLDALAVFSAKGIPCYDLTHGLLDITPVEGLKASKEPKVPVQETLEYQSTPEPLETLYEAVEDEYEDSEDDLEYTPEEELAMEYLYDAMKTIATVIADMVMREVKDRKK
jgi:hypothetical protein